MTSSAMQKWRNYIVPYFIYLLLLFLAPKPVKSWLDGIFPEMEYASVDLKKPLIPLVLAVAAHYLFNDFRRLINKANFDRVNQFILKRFQAEFGPQYDEWQRIRPAFYNAIDNDKSLTHLSDRIKFNGILWVGFADLQLASILTAALWMLGAATSYLLNFQDVASWINSGTWSLALLVGAAFGSHVTTNFQLRLVGEQLDQMFPLHKETILINLNKGRK